MSWVPGNSTKKNRCSWHWHDCGFFLLISVQFWMYLRQRRPVWLSPEKLRNPKTSGAAKKGPPQWPCDPLPVPLVSGRLARSRWFASTFGNWHNKTLFKCDQVTQARCPLWHPLALHHLLEKVHHASQVAAFCSVQLWLPWPCQRRQRRRHQGRGLSVRLRRRRNGWHWDGTGRPGTTEPQWFLVPKNGQRIGPKELVQKYSKNHLKIKKKKKNCLRPLSFIRYCICERSWSHQGNICAWPAEKKYAQLELTATAHLGFVCSAPSALPSCNSQYHCSQAEEPLESTAKAAGWAAAHLWLRVSSCCHHDMRREPHMWWSNSKEHQQMKKWWPQLSRNNKSWNTSKISQ